MSPATRRVLLWMCVLITVNQLAFSAITPVVALYAEAFGVSNTAIGLTFAIYGLARLILNIPSGRLADGFGRRHTLAIGGLLTAAGALACAYAPSYPLFLAARFVAGAGAAFVLTGGQIVLSDISEPTTRGRVMSLYQGVFLVGAGAGAFPGGWLATNFGLRAPFLASAALALIVTIVAWLRVPETRDLARFDDTGAALTQPPSFVNQLAGLMRSRGLVLISLVGLAAAFARTGGLFNVIPIIADQRMGLTPGQIGVGLGMVSIVSLIFFGPSGWMVDTFGRKMVIVPAAVISAIGMLAFTNAGGFASFIIACIIWSAASGISGAAPGAYAADVAPRGMNAAAMSLYRALSDVGYVMGPLALGGMTDAWGANPALFITSALIALTALLFWIMAPETMPRRGTA